MGWEYGKWREEKRSGERIGLMIHRYRIGVSGYDITEGKGGIGCRRFQGGVKNWRLDVLVV
jgi:hypothetical protein